MNKFDIKSIFIGFVIGILVVSIAFKVTEKISESTTEKKTVAVTSDEKSSSTNDKKDNFNASKGVTSASINSNKVYFNGKEIKLKKSLVTIETDESSDPQLYMPMDELLEYMHFKVDWNSKDNAVYLTMEQNNQEKIEVTDDIPVNEADAKAIEIMQKTGNWGYIEKYISHMSANGIRKVVDIYNSKHTDSSQHKNASDYIKN